MNRNKSILLITGMLATVAVGFVLAPSNIDPTDKWSWGENMGFMNWRDADGNKEGVVVDTGNNFLSGNIWCENDGWMNLGDGTGPYANTTGLDFGVNIEPDGDLKGFGWSENRGWVNFGWGADADDIGRAQFDIVAGRFRGYAWCENAGWINLDDGTHFVAIEPPPCLPPTVIADIASRHIEVIPDPGTTVPTAFRVECGAVTEWVQLIQTDYDDGLGTFVNIGNRSSGLRQCRLPDKRSMDQQRRERPIRNRSECRAGFQTDRNSNMYRLRRRGSSARSTRGSDMDLL